MAPPTAISTPRIGTDAITSKLAALSTETCGKNSLAAPLAPLNPATSPLLQFPHKHSTPVIGTEFPRGSVQLADLLAAPNSDDLIRDVGTLVSQRNVVFFRAQRLSVAQQKELGIRLGRLTGNPTSNKLHVHPTTQDISELGDEVQIISSEERVKGDAAVVKKHEILTYNPTERGSLSSLKWHADISFEPVPSDYAVLKMHTLPTTGGDTLWSSGYEVYDRLSPSFQKILEPLFAIHNASFFKHIADARGESIRGAKEGEYRGAPENTTDNLTAIHPIIRTNPVTGWRSVYMNVGFTKRIIGLTKEESDLLQNHIHDLIVQNHDLQVRFHWEKYDDDPEAFDVAIWDNRSSFHTATDDYLDSGEARSGDRVVSLGERPYFDPASKSRREALGLPPAISDRYNLI